MKTKDRSLQSLDHFIDRKIGEPGSPEPETFESDYEAFKMGVLIQQARERQGLTQEELALRTGANRSYISKLERNIKDIPLSTLKKIIHDGLGGHLDIKISFDSSTGPLNPSR